MTIPSSGTETGRIEENIFIHIELCICAKTIFFQRNCYFNFRQKRFVTPLHPRVGIYTTSEAVMALQLINYCLTN